ncbi:MAG: nicotinate phosphoribosyltransferase [Oligoflexia bacterium]|nr:nicotinate phosphoribosyltransferase [Oligoflexia bacterium]
MPDSALLTDSYQLSMMQAYLDAQMTKTAVFELFVRRLPAKRNFLIAAGIEQLIGYLEGLRFTGEEIAWLQKAGKFRASFLDYLRQLRFSGDVDAVDEGTPFFADEPIVRVIAPLPEAQLVESRLMNIVHFQSIVASKAARAALVAPEKILIDFGMRRAHGAEAALFAARASYVGGYSGTSTVQAGMLYDLPVYGTMAHSFVQAHASEEEAFEHFAKSHTGPVTLLIDTYDTEAAAEKVAQIAPRLFAQGIAIQGVRLDSGDLGAHAKNVRRIFDRAQLQGLRIFVSGSLDEEQIQDLLASGAPIDGFGVGTRLTTSADAPYLDCAYKLQEYAGTPRRKKSEGKATWPGRKQVYRFQDTNGIYLRDRLALEGESGSEANLNGAALLKPVMRGGKRLHPPLSVHAVRENLLRELTRIPPSLRKLEPAKPGYRVEISDRLVELARRLDQNSNIF